MNRTTLCSLVLLSCVCLAPGPPAASPTAVAVDTTPDGPGRGPGTIRPDTLGRVPVIVELDAAPLASYRGGVAGLRATHPGTAGAPRLDVRSSDSRAYLAYLDRKQAAFEAEALRRLTRPRMLRRLKAVLGGVAMLVKESEIEELGQLPGVKRVFRDELLQPDTEVSPGFIGAPAAWIDLGGQASAGEGVVVGVLDTGVWPEHPSLADPDPFGNAYPAPPGGPYACDFGDAAANPTDAPFACNNKLIGAYDLHIAYKLFIGLGSGEFDSARDSEGHGTHTASTAAGNGEVAASIFGIPRGLVSGVAPRAHVIAYKVCGAVGCFSTDSVAAVDQAILDGVDVINFSISGGDSPYTDAVSLAFLGAYDAGVFVAASAGNSGPLANTVAHREPWTTTVGASTTNRQFLSTLSLVAGNGDTLDLQGASVTPGVSTPTPIELATDPQCNFGMPPVTPGAVVVCDRGIFARVQKGFNAMTAGAGAMILRNVVPQGVTTDNHYIPSVHIESDAGATLGAFLAGHTGVTATFTTGAPAVAQGDVMASFSSRGGSAQTLGVSKPDVTAPGVQILAGNTPLPGDLIDGRPGELFQSIQGTSMSSPHVAGAAALLRDLHPTWTPGQIKSALMTTATTAGVVREDGATPAGPFEAGSGRIDLSLAGDPGVTFDESGANYLVLETELWNSNYPSLYFPDLPACATVRRTAHDVTGAPGHWTTSLSADPGLEILVPPELHVPAGGDAPFEIEVYAAGLVAGQVAHGTIRLDDGARRLHLPVTVVRGAQDDPLCGIFFSPDATHFVPGDPGLIQLFRQNAYFHRPGLPLFEGQLDGLLPAGIGIDALDVGKATLFSVRPGGLVVNDGGPIYLQENVVYQVGPTGTIGEHLDLADRGIRIRSLNAIHRLASGTDYAFSTDRTEILRVGAATIVLYPSNVYKFDMLTGAIELLMAGPTAIDGVHVLSESPLRIAFSPGYDRFITTGGATLRLLNQNVYVWDGTDGSIELLVDLGRRGVRNNGGFSLGVP